MNAKNFAGDSLREAIDKCRTHGVRTNITLNTLVHNREMRDVLAAVEELYILGADALIVADLGAAALIRKYFPDLELHAMPRSTSPLSRFCPSSMSLPSGATSPSVTCTTPTTWVWA